MKLSTSIAALIVGFSPAVLLAGAAADSAQDQPQTTQQSGAVSEPMMDTTNQQIADLILEWLAALKK